MKTKILAILLAVCLCVPLVFASCSGGTSSADPIDFFANGATMRPEASPEFDAYEKLETEGTFTLRNKSYIVEKITREDEITVSPEVGVEYTYTKVFTDYNIYKTEDLSKIATYTARTDSGYLDEEREDNEIVYANIYFKSLNAKGEGYLVVETRTYDDTYATKVINDKNEAILSYEGDTYKSIAFYGIPTGYMTPSSKTFHAVLDNVLYRFELDGKEAEVVKDLSLTYVDESLSYEISYDEINMSYYEAGKYVFVYDEIIAIYNDKLEAPKFVEFPLEEKETNQPHNVTELAIDGVYKLNNGNIYVLYEESKKLDCYDCENSCNIFQEEKSNYQWLKDTTGYNYKAFVIDIQSAKATETTAPSVVINSLTSDPNGIIELATGARLFREDIENLVSGYQIVDQMVETSKAVTGVMDNNGKITALAESPSHISTVFPIGEGQYVAQIGEVMYIVDKNYNIVREFLSGGNSTNYTTIIGDAAYNVLTGEKVFDIPEEWDIEGTTANLFIFVESEEVENEGVTETEYTILFIDEKGETVKSIPMNDYMDIYDYDDEYIVIEEEIMAEDEFGDEYIDYIQYTIYNVNGEKVVTIDADKYSTPDFYVYDDIMVVRYVEDLKEGATEAKTVIMVVSEATSSQGE